MPRAGGPLAVMLLEHDQGREYVAAIADELLHQHFAKEEEVLFPMADGVLGTDYKRELEERIKRWAETRN